MSHDVLFIPGPTEVRPEILAAMSRPMIGHRSAACKELVLRLREKLRPVFGTQAHVLFETCPATALMEAGMRNLARKRALVLTCGAFSERWHQIALACGKEADVLAVDWGRANGADAVAAALATGRHDVVTVTHNETSTGVINPLREIAAVVRRHPDVLLMVDAVTSLAGVPLEFDELGLDLAFAGTQKCLALPPGLTVFALSDRALARAAEVPARGWLMDFVRMAKGFQAGETSATPSLPHMFALDLQLDCIRAEGLSRRFERHAQMARMTQDWATRRGLAMFPDEGCRSPTVSTIRAGTLDLDAFLGAVRKKGFVVSNGYGKLKGATFRIGHMGDHSPETLQRLLDAMG